MLLPVLRNTKNKISLWPIFLLLPHCQNCNLCLQVVDQKWNSLFHPRTQKNKIILKIVEVVDINRHAPLWNNFFVLFCNRSISECRNPSFSNWPISKKKFESKNLGRSDFTVFTRQLLAIWFTLRCHFYLIKNFIFVFCFFAKNDSTQQKSKDL